MDSQSYLNEISAATRPVKHSKFGFMKSKFFIIGAALVGCFILFAIIGAILSNGKASVKEQTVNLLLRIEYTSEVASSYQANIKSSDLRSSSASLSGVFGNTLRDLTNYAEEKYNYKKSDFKKAVETEEERSQKLDEVLFDAKINGVLDRIFAHKMAYEMSLVYNMESSLRDASKDDKLKDLLTTSMNGLSNLYEKFDEFSEAK